MAEDHVLGALGLEKALRRAMQRNCLIRERHGGLSIVPVTVLADPQTIDVLAGQLRRYTSLLIEGGTGPLAQLLADVAIIVSHAGLKVISPSASSTELKHQAARISTDFALECAVALAASRGYVISVNRIPLGDLSGALGDKDGGLLRSIFQESLGARLARKPKKPSRELSAKSYWNLCSVADIDKWTDSAIVRLIEEYLSPPPSSLVAFYTNDVSGEDWRRLYRWLFG
jgi:hypothetical protein